MRARHMPLPKLWLMTDERMGEKLLPAIRRLPKGKAGVVLRNYHTPPKQRVALYKKVRTITRRNRLMLLLAGSPLEAKTWKADGWHGPARGKSGGTLLHSMAVHNERERIAADRVCADLVFISPVFPTRSHPGDRVLGPTSFARLARKANAPAIALGGMTSKNFRRMKGVGAYGYAAIDAWLKITR